MQSGARDSCKRNRLGSADERAHRQSDSEDDRVKTPEQAARQTELHSSKTLHGAPLSRFPDGTSPAPCPDNPSHNGNRRTATRQPCPLLPL